MAMRIYCRDLYVVSSFHKDRINLLKSRRQELSDSPGYSDPVFLEIIDSIVAYAEHLRNENNVVDDNAPSQAVDGAADKGPIQENVGAADKGSGDNGPGDKGPIEKNVEGSGNVAPQDAEPEREARSFYSSLPIGSATEEVFCLSELMERFPKTLGRLRRLEKEVIDFCFLDDEALDQR